MKIRIIQLNPALGHVKKSMEFHAEKIAQAVRDEQPQLVRKERQRILHA